MAVLRDASASQPVRAARLQQAREVEIAPRDLRTHLSEPDYTRPLLRVSPEQRERILGRLAVLYGRELAERWWPEFERMMRIYHAHKTPEMLAEDDPFDPAERFSERDVVLITYGDLLTSGDRAPLGALRDFVRVFMRGAINTVHILPFFPYSSDRGFSIVDFEQVDPRLGNWKDIEELGRRVRLMFDGVFNHVSSKSKWFQGFLNGDPEFQDYFTAFSTRDAIHPDHLRLILRPRASDLLSRFDTIRGPRFVWTTFSRDQVDLDYHNPRVLVAIVSILLLYVRRGADIIRLDAVTYIWRELGTRCAHLEETHALVQLFRTILDVVAPQVALITETNVPHQDNISYLGDGRNEAQMVYNFALPPLVLHTFHTGSTKRLCGWARTLAHVSDTATYFNFLDSHDGIGLMGAQGILGAEEIDALVARCYAHGGLVSFRDTGEGRKCPYEMNITWYSALNQEGNGEPQALQVDRFVAARSIALVLRGVPGIYLPSLFGAKNDTAAILAGDDARAINRKTIDEEALFALLGDRESWVHQVAVRFRRLIQRRVETRAFHPNADQEILSAGQTVFAVLRTTRDGRERVLALTSVTAHAHEVRLTPGDIGGRQPAWRDLLCGQSFPGAPDGGLALILRPYGVLWLTPV
jgi:glycosidase